MPVIRPLTANRQAKRIRQIFRWAVSWELCPVEVVHRLDTVRALAIGETTAAKLDPRLAVPEADIAAVRDVLKPHYRDLSDSAAMGQFGSDHQRRRSGVWPEPIPLVGRRSARVVSIHRINVSSGTTTYRPPMG